MNYVFYSNKIKHIRDRSHFEPNHWHTYIYFKKSISLICYSFCNKKNPSCQPNIDSGIQNISQNAKKTNRALPWR